MPSLNTAYNYVVEKCNAPDVGYSQAYRKGQWYNGAYRWDCSSLMCDALYQGGFYSVNPWWSTHVERQELKELGFYEYASGAVVWEPGDILEGWTYGNGICRCRRRVRKNHGCSYRWCATCRSGEHQ